MRTRLCGEQNWRCCYCQCVVIEPPRGVVCHQGTLATIEHVQTRERGGRQTWDNCVIACLRCNSSRGDRPALDYFYFVQAALSTGLYRRL